jgi:hypothetical protein
VIIGEYSPRRSRGALINIHTNEVRKGAEGALINIHTNEGAQ